MAVRPGRPAGRAERNPGRRDLLLLAAGMALSWGSAPADERKRRIGFVDAGSPGTDGDLLDAFRDGLSRLGWRDGGNVEILARWAEAHDDRLPTLVDEVIWSGVDVLVTGAASSAIAAGKVTRTIPVVLVGEPDPVAFGLAASVKQPGGNVTGLVSLSLRLVDRQFQLLRDTVPTIRRVAALAISQEPSTEQRWRYVQAASGRLGLSVVELEAATPEAIERAFVLLQHYPCDGLWVAFDGSAIVDPARVVAHAVAARLPAIYPSRRFVAAGGMMSYGADMPDLFRRAAGYVDNILRGANPGDLAFETPDKFEFVVNRHAAKELGVVIPPTILNSANEVIEATNAPPPVAATAAGPAEGKESWLTKFEKNGE